MVFPRISAVLAFQLSRAGRMSGPFRWLRGTGDWAARIITLQGPRTCSPPCLGCLDNGFTIGVHDKQNGTCILVPTAWHMTSQNLLKPPSFLLRVCCSESRQRRVPSGLLLELPLATQSHVSEEEGFLVKICFNTLSKKLSSNRHSER